MTVRSRPYFWLECDRCGTRSTEECEINAWSNLESAEMDAAEADWDLEGDNHICFGCIPHPPDWDDEHYAAYTGESVLDCAWCTVSDSLVAEGG